MAAWRPARVDLEHVARLDWRTQTRGMGVRISEWLRDRLRAGWLRVRR